MSTGFNQNDRNAERVTSPGEETDASREPDAFTQLAEQEDPGLIREFIDFLKYNKKWWLTPIFIVTLVLIGAAILLPSPVAPFIYTLF